MTTATDPKITSTIEALLDPAGADHVVSVEAVAKTRRLIRDLRDEKRNAEADLVERALWGAALRAVALRSNEAEVRSLVWAALGL